MLQVATRAEHEAKGVVAQYTGDILVIDRFIDLRGDRRQQVVGVADTRAGDDVLPVVGFEQDHRLAGAPRRRRGHGFVDVREGACAIEQAGNGVALQLRDEGRVDGLLAEHDLQAGFAFERRMGEFDHGLESAAVVAAGEQFHGRRYLLALGEPAQDGLEVVGMRAGDQVEDGQADDVIELGEAEGFQVGLVHAYVHAFVDIGDGVARGIEQGVAAAFRLAQRGFQPAYLSPCEQRAELALDHRQQLVGVLAQRHAARAAGVEIRDGVIVEAVHHGDQGKIAAAGIELAHHRRGVDTGHAGAHQHEVRDDFVERSLDFVRVRRAGGTHGDAAVAQNIDQELGIFHRVLDEEDPDDVVVFHAVPNCRLPTREPACRIAPP